MKTKIMEALKRLAIRCDVCGKPSAAHGAKAGHKHLPKRITYRDVMGETGLTYAQVSNNLHIMRMESGAKSTRDLARL